MRTDMYGRRYAKLEHLRAGTEVELDDGFTCCPPGRQVLEADLDGVFFRCTGDREYAPGTLLTERHGVDGQVDDRGYCVGVYLVKSS